MYDFLRDIPVDLVSVYEKELFRTLSITLYAPIFDFFLRDDLLPEVTGKYLTSFNNYFKEIYVN